MTLDLTPAHQTLYPVSGFQAEPHFISLPGDTDRPADLAQPLSTQPSSAGAPADQESSAAPAEIPARPEPPLASVPTAPTGARSSKTRRRDEIDQYLWSVYQRSATKRDSSGDFTWKDEAAAARLGLVTKQYVIGGMDLDFRELLYNLGHAMDAAGLKWTILSGFRDDYRQSLASGYKARVGNSFHGGSRATGGYGHGCAADIEAVDGESDNAVWKWVDQHGEKFGIFRPMKQIDPAHIQPFGGWHDVAFNLRDKREMTQNAYLPASIDGADAEKPVRSLVDTRSGVSEAQFDCVRSHGGHFRLAGLTHHHGVTGGGRMHRAVLFHPGRMHRFGRRRMIAEFVGAERRAGAEIMQSDQAAGQTGANAKAEASNNNRRDAAQRNVADAGRQENRQGRAAASREAVQSADRAQRNAKAQEANGHPQDKARKVADSRRPQKHAADASQQHAKASQAKARNHVADHQDSSSRDVSSRKL